MSKINEKASSNKNSTKNGDKSTQKQTGQNGGNLEEDRGQKCFACEKTVGTKDSALQCDCCNYWHHIECEKVTPKSYKYLSSAKEDGVKWFCRKCNQGAECLLQQIIRINQKQSITDERLDYVENKIHDFEEMEERLANLEKKIDEKLASVENSANSATSYAKVASKGLDKKDVEQLVEKQTKIKIKEIEDKARRQTNMIIFRLPEANEETEEEKVSEDETTVTRIIRCELKCANEKPVKMFRLKGNAKFKDRPRPVKVVFKSQSDRDSVLKAFNERKKKTSNDDDRLCTQISIRKDMTRSEREADEKLFKELKRRQEQSKAEEDVHAIWIRKQGKVVNVGVYPRQENDSDSEEEEQ